MREARSYGEYIQVLFKALLRLAVLHRLSFGHRQGYDVSVGLPAALSYPAPMLHRSVNNFTPEILAYANKEPERIIIIYDDDERIATVCARGDRSDRRLRRPSCKSLLRRSGSQHKSARPGLPQLPLVS